MRYSCLSVLFLVCTVSEATTEAHHQQHTHANREPLPEKSSRGMPATPQSSLPPCPSYCHVTHYYEFQESRVFTNVLPHGSSTLCRSDYVGSPRTVNCCHNVNVACKTPRDHCVVEQTSRDGVRHDVVKNGDEYPECPYNSRKQQGRVYCRGRKYVSTYCSGVEHKRCTVKQTTGNHVVHIEVNEGDDYPDCPGNTTKQQGKVYCPYHQTVETHCSAGPVHKRCTVKQTTGNHVVHIEVNEGDDYPDCPGNTTKQQGKVYCPYHQTVETHCSAVSDQPCTLTVHTTNGSGVISTETRTLKLGERYSCNGNQSLSDFETVCCSTPGQQLVLTCRIC